MAEKIITYKNKKALYKFEIIEKLTAGIVLLGTEIKSIRQGKINFSDSYCTFRNGELWIIGLHISEYTFGTCNNHEPTRERKLLLTRRELSRLEKKVSEKGLTIVPLSLFINEKEIAKLEIALARGKKLHDKREDIKTRDNKRDLDRMSKHR
ncbi:MAG: SsrA-binding protein SmpB [Bacteroidales bacterium]|jgi:SsrA-binding protein|nr:SsrA-binding protein SmpB [Bacteroidales bacterium]HOL99046.1 SsrA-binding protein SmpB [Bacteroidales bacterium]HOM37437.1 SsrA-binding protein SmpB [Bacteroidales bacterium]HPD24919.1 SsrA-binding protein SmpB [Bacteroidales bacterium]HRT00616.1 SsrA-binding protein SmpB [Bacteroidales bacterium]